MVYKNDSLGFLAVMEISHATKNRFFEAASTDMTFIWNRGCPMNVVVNQMNHQLLQNEVVILTNHHRIDGIDFESARLIKFDLPFVSHSNDAVENDLKGTLFFNPTHVPILSITEAEMHAFESSWEVFRQEMKSRDSLQYAMLQSILQRLMILCTRKLKKEHLRMPKKREADILREYRFLVENYFSKHHDVAFYASMLNKSPKTLSNLFSSLSDRTPIDIIHERIMTQARTQIYYTTKSIKEIAYDLGYEDIQTFSRFFKNKEGLSPLQYRESRCAKEEAVTD
ncbi:helix-turn-helix domain-containing protein [Flavobacterium sp.]|uniref:AraC family transcriptional regulator n=1 Tax=Flavobacterium sp. TaxID=239 RepID=UPI0039E23217